MSETHNEQVMDIGWIGTGVMGAAMAGHLLDAGHRLRVHTRTKSKANDLLARGATWADSPAAAADGADIAVSIVGYPEDVEQVHLGEAGTLAASQLPRVIVDMTTSRPSLATTLFEKAQARGVGSVDAPVSGGDVGARNAALSIMVGGQAEDVAIVKPIFNRIGRVIVHHGPAGAGQHAKMVNQILVAGSMMSVCEALVYARRAGLDATKVIESVGSGAAGSWTVNNLGPRIVNRDFDPGFYIEHFIKDLGIALDEAARMQLTLPSLALARQWYDIAQSQGLGRLGTQALMLVLERANGMAAESPSH